MSGPAYIDSFRLIRILPDDITIAADAVDDTLTLVAGPGISLVANAGSDQITIVNTGTSSPDNELVAKSLTVDSINIDTNVIQINESNADLIVRANANGSVILESGISTYEFDPTGILKVSENRLFINPSSNNTNRSWYFENTVLGLPSVGDGTLVSELRLPVSDNTSTSSIIFPGAGAPNEWGGIAYITEPGGILEDLYANALNVYMVGADVRITAQNELNVETAKQWTFKTDGALQFPDGSIQTTAWTGSVFFNIAGDDSTQKTVTSGETIKFTGASNITVTTDSEGNVTITGPNLANQSNWDEAYSWGNHALAGYLTSAQSIGDDVTVGSIRINTNVIQTVDSNANLELRASGTGAVLVESVSINGTTIDSADSSAITITPDVVFEAGVTVGNHIVPSSNENIDLGSNTNRFRDLYLSGSTIKLGDATISSSGPNIVLPANTTIGGSTVSALVSASASSITASSLGLGNVTNESKATMFTNPTFTGNVSLSDLGTIQWTSGAFVQGTTTNIAMGAPGLSGGIVTASINGWVSFTGAAVTDNGDVVRTYYDSNASGVVSYSVMNNSSVYMRTPAANWTINFSALLGFNGYTHNFEIFVEQGATPYLPTAVQVGGVPQTILWEGGVPPIGTPNGTDHIQFKILTEFPGGTYIVKASASSSGVTTLQQTVEVLDTKTGATGTVNHDFLTSAIWYHSSISSNFTANFTNVPTTNNRVISIALVLIQGATPYIPNAVQIAGTPVTINWQDNAVPTGNANKQDIVSFTLLRVGNAWSVLGSLSTFG